MPAARRSSQRHSCPADSEIGTIEVTSPFVADPVAGTCVLRPADRRRALPGAVRLRRRRRRGHRRAAARHDHVDEQTGQITSMTVDQPQLPFDRFELAAARRRPRGAGQPEQLRLLPRRGDLHALERPGRLPDRLAAVRHRPGLRSRLPAGARASLPALDASISNTAARGRTHLRTIVTRSDNDQQLTGAQVPDAAGADRDAGRAAALPARRGLLRRLSRSDRRSATSTCSPAPATRRSPSTERCT